MLAVQDVVTWVQRGGTEGSHAVVPALRQLAAEGVPELPVHRGGAPHAAHRSGLHHSAGQLRVAEDSAPVRGMPQRACGALCWQWAICDGDIAAVVGLDTAVRALSGSVLTTGWAKDGAPVMGHWSRGSCEFVGNSPPEPGSRLWS